MVGYLPERALGADLGGLQGLHVFTSNYGTPPLGKSLLVGLEF